MRPSPVREPSSRKPIRKGENGSFLRLKTLTLGYTIPKALQEKAKIQNARIYLQAQNLFTITGYSGADPEGLGYPYALPRQFTMGFQLGF